MSTLHELIKYGSFLGGSGGSSGGDWEVLADLQIDDNPWNVQITEFPDGGPLIKVKKLFVYGRAVRDENEQGGKDGVWINTSENAGGIALCGGQTTAGTMVFMASLEVVGKYLIATNIMSSNSNTYAALVYKTNYNTARNDLLGFDENAILVFKGFSNVGNIFGPGSKLLVMAVRDK